MLDFMPPNSIFVVDTSEYAGDFEKDLCYFLTGKPDAYYKPKFVFHTEFPNITDYFDDHLVYLTDEEEDSCYHTICPTPGMLNVDTCQGWKVGADPQVALEQYKQGRRAHWERFRDTSEKEVAAGNRSWQKTLDYSKEELSKVDKLTELPKLPFYGSVAIFLNKPTEEVIDFLKKRATQFCSERGIHIRGFRLLTFKLEERELPIN